MTLKSQIQEKALARLVAKLVQKAQKINAEATEIPDNYGDGSEEIERMR